MEFNNVYQENNDIDTYTVEDIMKFLKIGKTSAYEFIKDAYRNNKYFKVIKIGKLYRINKKSFDSWFTK